jgi:hypothetical protein
MVTKQIIYPFQVAIGAGLLSALVLAAPAQAADDGAWLQEQLSISDGSPTAAHRDAHAVPSGERSTVAKPTFRPDAGSEWVQEQLAVSDGSPGVSRGQAEQPYVGAPSPSDGVKFDNQFAFFQHGLRITDGSNM